MKELLEIQEHLEQLKKLGTVSKGEGRNKHAVVDFEQMSIHLNHSPHGLHREDALFDKEFIESFYDTLDWIVSECPLEEDIIKAYATADKNVMRMSKEDGRGKSTSFTDRMKKRKSYLGERNALNFALEWTQKPTSRNTVLS